jgi:hypothetical protein
MSGKRSAEKKNFSSFDVASAMKLLGIDELIGWKPVFDPIQPSAIFFENLERMNSFDLTATERAKELIIDEFFKESLTRHPSLKVWKAAPLKGEIAVGAADYVLAPRRRYLETPLLCVAEAKRDDFEQGLAQCLVEMAVCRRMNETEGMAMDVYGIVTNGSGWVFYRLDLDGNVYESGLYSTIEPETVLGAIGFVLGKCEENLRRHVNLAA